MTAPFRVIVTGSRDWDDPQAVYDALNPLLDGHDRLIVVHGGCPTGADFYAAGWTWAARYQHGADRVWAEVHRAQWQRHGNRAGPIRNSLMIALGAGLCVVFAGPCTEAAHAARRPHVSHGTEDCADKAQAAGIPIDPHGPFADRWAQQTLEAL